MKKYTEDEIRSIFESTFVDKKDLNRENWEYVSERIQVSWISFKDGFNKAVELFSKPGNGYIASKHSNKYSDIWAIRAENIGTEQYRERIPGFIRIPVYVPMCQIFKCLDKKDVTNGKETLIGLGFKVHDLNAVDKPEDHEEYPDGSTFLVD